MTMAQVIILPVIRVEPPGVDLARQDTRSAQCVLYEYRFRRAGETQVERDWKDFEDALKEYGG